jgi:uncharacterized protein YkwD
MQMLRPISAVFAAFMLILAFTAVAAGPALASQRTANEAIMLQLINHARTQRGLAPLRVHAALSRAALAHSRDMMRHQYFSHSSPGGANCAGRARRAGYAKSGCRPWVGEVLGWGTSSVGTPQAVFSNWMRSAYHRSIILGRRWRDAGVGSVSGTFKGASGAWMYTVDVGRLSK